MESGQQKDEGNQHTEASENGRRQEKAQKAETVFANQILKPPKTGIKRKGWNGR